MTTPTRNGSPADRQFSPRDWRLWALGLLTVCLIGVGVSSYLSGQAADDATAAAHRARRAAQDASRAVREVRRVEVKDNRATRQAAYRLCTRNRIDRAFAHSRVEAAAGIKALRALERTDGLPILDCGPNLEGDGAKPLPVREQRAFVRAWMRRKLSPRELGICPSSRIATGEDPSNC